MAYANRARAYTLLGEDAQAQQDVERAVKLGVDRAPLEAAIQVIQQGR